MLGCLVLFHRFWESKNFHNSPLSRLEKPLKLVHLLFFFIVAWIKVPYKKLKTITIKYRVYQWLLENSKQYKLGESILTDSSARIISIVKCNESKHAKILLGFIFQLVLDGLMSANFAAIFIKGECLRLGIVWKLSEYWICY